MSSRKKQKILLDAVMTVLLPVLMTYSLVGEAAHEWLGIGMLLLFVSHHLLNAPWHRGLFRGRYTLLRTVYTGLDILLTVDMQVMSVSGVLVSKYLFTFLPVRHGMYWARTAHMLGSYWGFLLISVHSGCHIQTVLGKWISKHLTVFQQRVLIAVLCAFGVYAFWRNQIGKYLFLQSEFVFVDYSRSFFLVYVEYLGIMLLFMMVGSFLSLLLRQAVSSKRIRRQTHNEI